MSHLRAGAERVASPLYAVLDDEEASKLRYEGTIALQEIGGGRQVAVELQPPVALVGLLKRPQPAQAAVHLHAPARTCTRAYLFSARPLLNVCALCTCFWWPVYRWFAHEELNTLQAAQDVLATVV